MQAAMLGPDPPLDAPDSGDDVKSARRTLDILALFDEQRRPLPSSEVAVALGYPLSSTSALLRTIAHAGFLHYDAATRRYQPSARVAMLGTWLSPALFREGRLLRLMEDLSDRSGETIMLATQNGVRAQYVHVIQATRPLRVHVRPGSYRSMLRSAAGWMLLSTHPDAAVRRLVLRINAEAPSAHRVSPNAAVERVRQIRAEGHAISLDGVTMGAGGVAMLVPGQQGPPLALVVVGLSDHLRRETPRVLAGLHTALRDHALAA